uniref:uncharacterized protein LOC122589866 n=1 Tax=Erigeron canadensis TaxID=72917 RepID=UPI001CB92FB4|nr:uncharacterized protein LOC122589866 [Erigeron canadensis]
MITRAVCIVTSKMQLKFSRSLPKYTSSVAQRSLKGYCVPYIEVANIYTIGDVSELGAFVQANHEKFENLLKREMAQDNQLSSSCSKLSIRVSILLPSPRNSREARDVHLTH